MSLPPCSAASPWRPGGSARLPRRVRATIRTSRSAWSCRSPRAAPDGYTIFLGNVGTISINPTLFGKELTVKPEKDFAPVTLVAETPGLMIANPKFPPNSVKELVDYVKKNPGKVNYASPGSGSLNRLEFE